MWNTTVRTLSNYMVPDGWTREDPDNLPLLLHPDRSVLLMVTTGDGATGRPERFPQSKNVKGSKVAGLIQLNATQMELVTLERHPQHLAAETFLWVLLLHRDEKHKELRLELSRPSSISSNRQRINGWSERIILSPIEFDDDTFVDVGIPTAQAPETRVEVNWKRG